MPIDRRDFLRAGSLALAAAALEACDSRGPRSAVKLLDFAERRNETVERGLFRHRSMDRVDAGARVAGAAFPMYYISKQPPVWDPKVRGAWTLEVSGAVQRPLTLTLEQLAALPGVSQRVNHYCVEGWTAIASWTGVRLRDLAALVQPAPEAKYVDFQSFDADYHESWDIESATHPQTLIAYGMDGAPLGPAHGGPARVYSPVKLGYKNTKYLTKVVFMPERNGGYWSDQGYEWYGGI
jgi:DMSO/TMAO reductase YedYZ molybdopterin-dependent catalytic subunit